MSSSGCCEPSCSTKKTIRRETTICGCDEGCDGVERNNSYVKEGHRYQVDTNVYPRTRKLMKTNTIEKRKMIKARK